MKNQEKNSTTKRNLNRIIRIAGITFGMFALIVACDPPNDENDATNDDADSVKTTEIQNVDSTAVLDTAKKVDVTVKKL